ncbi:kunitz-type protease inhibitor 1-like isoform X2 [Stegostoma tigrinum]|uniref:kunitz-type protease inhibitor 1-like isoform X2 n=1 Tax=Stegostoma tigrinum TaxID=3053191 RepID=UPI00286FEE24|nr:kunitz-type protease inhibitor 1-like isoform X2 [Stegostoma tigrinum]
MAQLFSICWLTLVFLRPATSGSVQDSCLRSYNVSRGLSLHSQSFEAGAELLSSSLVQSSQACLDECCSILGCNLALWQETAVQGKHICLLVNCLSANQPVCTFTPRPGFQVSTRFLPAHRSIDPTGSPQVDCLSPSKTGPCRASFPRWFYNVSSKMCKGFIYGGCLPNGNNFKSEQDCLKHCQGVTAPASNYVPVSSRSVIGLKDCSTPCVASQFQCADGCCIARQLLCDGTTRCLDKSDDSYCQAVRDSYDWLTKKQGPSLQDNEHLPEPQKHQSNVDDQDSCFALAVTGKCRASFPRWYYNPGSRACERFTYGGCGGNKNNYPSESACMARCSGKADNSKQDHGGNFNTQHHPEAPHRVPAISMVILLSICVLVLLGGVIYFIVKLTKSDPVASYQRAPHGEDKENLISTVQNL